MTNLANGSTTAVPWTLVPKAFALRIAAVVALLSGGWYAGVRPMRESLARDEAELRSVQSALSSQVHSLLSETQISELNGSILSSSRRLVAWTQSGSETDGFYNRVRHLAESHKVKIVRIEPRSAGIVPPPSGEKPPEGLDAPDIRTSAYTLQVDGDFEEIARFLDALDDGLGASKVISFRLVPLAGNSKQLVEASIDTIHYRIASRLDERMTSSSETK